MLFTDQLSNQSTAMATRQRCSRSERRIYILAQAVNDISPQTACSPAPLHNFVAATFIAKGQSHSEAHNARVAGSKAWIAQDIAAAIGPMATCGKLRCTSYALERPHGNTLHGHVVRL